jgi:hypothetical protein
MSTILARNHNRVSRDQKIGRQTESTASRFERRRRSLPEQDRRESFEDAKQDRLPRSRVKKGPHGRFHTEVRVQRLMGIRDHGEGETSRVREQFLIARMEHDHLKDTGRPNLVVSPYKGLQVQVANGTSGEATKL